MRMYAAWSSLILLVAAAIACRPAGAASPRPVPAAAKTNTTMYVQLADTGIMKFKSTTGCTFELDLTGANPLTTWFTDRPQRQSGRFANARFFRFIGATAKDPVNAAVVVEIAGRQAVVPVELWGGKASKGKLSYRGRWLKAGAASKFDTTTTKHLPCDRRASGRSAKFELVQLFIDGAPPSESMVLGCDEFALQLRAQQLNERLIMTLLQFKRAHAQEEKDKYARTMNWNHQCLPAAVPQTTMNTVVRPALHIPA